MPHFRIGTGRLNCGSLFGFAVSTRVSPFRLENPSKSKVPTMKMNFNLSLFTSAATLSTKTVLAVTLSLSGLAQAADYAWDGTTGNWADTTWTPGPITGPTASTDTASINAGTVTINSLTINSAIAINSGATVVANAVDGVGNVVFGGNLTGAGTLTKAGAWSLFLGGDNSGFSGTINASSSNILFTADSAGSAASDLVITAGNIVNNQSGTGRVIQLGSLAGSGGRLGSNSSGSEVTFEIGGNGKSTAFSGQIVNTPPGWGGGQKCSACWLLYLSRRTEKSRISLENGNFT
jgi:hypothetical protein